METIDKRDILFQLEEIYKYKDLITSADKDIIKKIIYDGDEKSMAFYDAFMNLVADEIDHQLNKAEFTVKKDKLVIEMDQYLESK